MLNLIKVSDIHDQEHNINPQYIIDIYTSKECCFIVGVSNVCITVTQEEYDRVLGLLAKEKLEDTRILSDIKAIQTSYDSSCGTTVLGDK